MPSLAWLSRTPATRCPLLPVRRTRKRVVSVASSTKQVPSSEALLVVMTLRNRPAVAARTMALTLELRQSMVVKVIAMVKRSILRHSVPMAVIKKSTVGMSSKTLQTAAMQVATVTKSELRLTRPTLEAMNSALSDTSFLALMNKATVVAVMMMMAAMVAVVKRRAATAVTVDTDTRKRAAMDARSRAVTAVTVATDVKRRAATVAATVAAAAVMSAVRRVVVMAVARRVDMAVARRVDMAAITTDVKTRAVSAEALPTNMSVKVREAMDVIASVVAAMKTKTTTTVVSDDGKLFDDHFDSIHEGSRTRTRRVEYTR